MHFEFKSKGDILPTKFSEEPNISIIIPASLIAYPPDRLFWFRSDKSNCDTEQLEPIPKKYLRHNFQENLEPSSPFERLFKLFPT